MYLSRTHRHFGLLVIAGVLTSGAATIVSAEATGMNGPHDFHAQIVDDCRLNMHDPARAGEHNPAEMMQKFADELGLSGQQQQDLKILTTDYAERLRDLAKLMRESSEQLMKTEPGDPNYWPLAQEVSALAATSSAETVILLSEMREKVHTVLTAEQRAELRRRIEARKAQCKPQIDADHPAE